MPDLDADSAVGWYSGEGVVEEQIHVGLAGRQLAALRVADPGGLLQATEQHTAAGVLADAGDGCRSELGRSGG
jgi:hypothetical protein